MLRPEQFEGYAAAFHEQRPVGTEPAATIVIVTYFSGTAVLDLLDSLEKQTLKNFETILINNGGLTDEVIGKIRQYPLLYMESNTNSPCLARNMGIAYSASEIVLFLDDDCVADKNVVASHVSHYRDPSILGVQGKGVSKSSRYSFYQQFQSHYDLGPDILPAVIGSEGNGSFRRSALQAVDGFNPELFGGEGLDLSYRIVKEFGRREALIYDPAALIMHDYAKGLLDYLEKSYRHAKMRVRLLRTHPRLLEYSQSYGPYPTPTPERRSLLLRLAAIFVGRLGMLAEFLGRTVAE